MQITKKTGYILGILLLVETITSGLATNMQGLNGIDPKTSGFLLELIKSTPKMHQSIYLDILSGALAIVIAAFLYPGISKYNSKIALIYAGSAYVSFALITLANILHLEMLNAAELFSIGGGNDPEMFTPLIAVLFEGHQRLHFLMLILQGAGGIALNYFFYTTQLVKKWLAVWGMAASAIVLLGSTMQLLGIKASFFIFLHNGIFSIVISLYLIFSGFQISTYKKSIAHM